MQIRLSLYKVLFASLLFLSEPHRVNASEDACSAELTISAPDDWQPYSWKSEDGEYHGIDIDFLTAAFSTLNYCWSYNTYPSSSRAFREFQKGNVDVIFAASFSDERASWSIYSVPYRFEDMRVVYFKGDKTLDWLSSSSIAINRGGFYGEVFEQFRKQCSTCIYESNTAYERLNMVQNKRVKYAIEDYATIQYLKKEFTFDNIEASDENIHSNDIFLMLRPGALTPSQLQDLDTVLENNSKKLNMR